MRLSAIGLCPDCVVPLVKPAVNTAGMVCQECEEMYQEGDIILKYFFRRE